MRGLSRRATVLVLVAVLVGGAVTSPPPTTAASPSDPEWLQTVEPQEILTWDDGNVVVRKGAKIPKDYRQLVGQMADGLNTMVAAGRVTVSPEFEVTFTDAGQEWAWDYARSVMTDPCFTVVNVSVSWQGVISDAEQTCDDATMATRVEAFAGGSSSAESSAVAMATSNAGCWIGILGVIVAAVAYIYSPPVGMLIQRLTSRLSLWFTVFGVAYSCSEVQSIQGQKYNGWGWCPQYYYGITQENFNCGTGYYWH